MIRVGTRFEQDSRRFENARSMLGAEIRPRQLPYSRFVTGKFKRKNKRFWPAVLRCGLHTCATELRTPLPMTTTPVLTIHPMASAFVRRRGPFHGHGHVHGRCQVPAIERSMKLSGSRAVYHRSVAALVATPVFLPRRRVARLSAIPGRYFSSSLPPSLARGRCAAVSLVHRLRP